MHIFFVFLKVELNIVIYCRVDGGVSKNDFILQLLADLTGLEVERASSTEISILGIIFLTGLQCGM